MFVWDERSVKWVKRIGNECFYQTSLIHVTLQLINIYLVYFKTFIRHLKWNEIFKFFFLSFHQIDKLMIHGENTVELFI